MYRFNVLLASFDNGSDFETLSSVVAAFVDALALANVHYLKANPDTPGVYDSGVRYVEDKGSDDWCDIPEVLRRGFADCDDIAAWRIAELLVRGDNVKAGVDVVRKGNEVTYHAFVRHADGSTEDPTARIAG